MGRPKGTGMSAAAAPERDDLLTVKGTSIGMGMGLGMGTWAWAVCVPACVLGVASDHDFWCCICAPR